MIMQHLAGIFNCITNFDICGLERLLTIDASCVNDVYVESGDQYSSETFLTHACNADRLRNVTAEHQIRWVAIIQCLLRHGADANASTMDEDMETPLECVWSVLLPGLAQLQATRLLLKAGANPDKIFNLFANLSILHMKRLTREHVIAFRMVLHARGQTLQDYVVPESPLYMSARACEAACIALLGVRKHRDVPFFKHIPRELVAQMARAVWEERWEFDRRE